MKKRTKNALPRKPALLRGAAALLLLSSTVGSTRAALTYYSDNYAAQIEMSSIGVALLENKAEVSGQNYGDNATTTGALLKNMLSDGEKFTPGKPYDEALSVRLSLIHI